MKAKGQGNVVIKQLPIMITDKVKYIDDSIGWSGLFITKNNKNPERAIQFVKFLKSDEGCKLTSWGIEGKHYTLDKDGYPVVTPEYAAKAAALETYIQTEGIGCWGMCASGKWGGIMSYNPGLPVQLKALLDWKKVYQFKPWFHFVIPPVDTDQATIYTKLNQLTNDAQLTLIVQKTEADFNKKFDEIMKNAEAMGMKDLEKWMTAKYAEVIKRYQN
jgi:putative aldouronate transport system substrate-binding protein